LTLSLLTSTNLPLWKAWVLKDGMGVLISDMFVTSSVGWFGVSREQD
jgi:hypothetical protein